MDVLDKLVAAGFALRTLPAYERHIGIERDNFIALVEPTPEGALRRFSAAGYLLEGRIALLVERRGEKFFVFKDKWIAASAELLARFDRFQKELDAILCA
ncbi:MAG TPA: hypothetical protein VNN17_06240 [Terriglobia bacterium]|nr:hypothetical protein [Terriglobia bacterium]